ncbi:MAG TPA: ABC transporter ATP-binding protein [Magnetospirillaceae bacterium]|jgi:branched-chain amino acid transport system ATP-binding protein
MSLLAIQSLKAFYGDFQALFGVDLEIVQGQTVAVIGANGAGKTTLLRSVMGMLAAPSDVIRFDGKPIGGLATHAIVAEGIAMVPEGRKLFPSLSVEENLRVGAYPKRQGPWTLERIYALFPRLSERRNQPATSMSGGEQQMAAIGRALMSNPRLLLCDEISLGLAPVAVRELYRALPGISAEGVSLLVIEQDIGQAMAVANQVYCLQEGRVTLAGKPNELTRERVAAAYFGN